MTTATATSGAWVRDDLKTPHLDRLAADGARFTDRYSNSPVCSPSRAALLTGRHPARTGITDVLGGHRSEPGLSPEIPTLTTALKPLGYRTGLVGKWHLGVAEGYRPSDHGFDEWFGLPSGTIDYFSHIDYNLWLWDPTYYPVHDLWENDREVWRNGRYMTELISENAVEFLRRGEGADTPFFLHVAYNAPHSPMHAPAEYIDRFPELTPARRVMAAMISAMDDGVGAIVAELERQGQLENTCIIFMSDNGPSRHPANWLDGNLEPYYGASAGALRGGKTSLFEGGLRSPSLMHWPAMVPGGQVISEPIVAIDVFPTLLAAAGGDPAEYDIDGLDVLPVVSRGASSPHDQLFWEFRQQTAVRRGPWKLTLRPYESDDNLSEHDVFLADLSNDIGETNNLRHLHPELTEELTAAALAWRDDVAPYYEEQDWIEG